MIFLRVLRLLKKKGFKYTLLTSKNELQKFFYLWLTKFLYKRSDKTYYGQYAEDLIIDRLLGYKADGFYVDIGANHPVKLSNTKKFYDRGWHGINVEPNPEALKLFNVQRPRDINLNVGVSRMGGPLDFYKFETTEISTFEAQQGKKLISEGFKLEEVVRVETVPLSEIFNKALDPVDFLSIDTEEYNFEVLKSNDWEKNSPRLICIENDNDADYNSYLSQFGYKKVYTNLLNTFFVRQ
jgi:FkbM family methyltransferase